MTFNFKKAALAIAASAVFMGCMSFGSVNAYADDTEDGVAVSESDDNIEQSEEMESDDGLWTYTIITDKSKDTKTVCLEKYKGDETEVTFPDEIDGTEVTSLGDYTLYENQNVTKVYIPSYITEIGRSTFFACTSLKEFDVDDDNDSFADKDGCLMSRDGIKFLGLPAGQKKTEFTVPDGVRALGPSAFATCGELKKINLPDTLELIDFYCFAECKALNNVVLPDKMTSLEMFAFTGCTSLTDINFPEGLTEIGGGAFFNCTSLKEVAFPKSLTAIGQCAFVSTGFDEVEIPVYVQDIGYSAFGYTTDESGQLEPMKKFTIKGVEGSYAHQYAADSDNSHIEFVKVDPPEELMNKDSSDEDSADSKTDDGDKNGFKKIAILAGAALGGIAVIAAIAFLIRKLTGKNSSSKNSEENSSEDNELSDIEPMSEEKDEENSEENDQ